MTLKVVALMKDANWSGDRAYLVEMSAKEITTVIGQKYGYDKIKIGMVAEPAEIYDHTAKILTDRHVTINAAKNLRAMAELLESLEPVVEAAINLPEGSMEE